MSIKIQVVREVSSAGEEGYRVKAIEALKKDELPKAYTSQKDHVYLSWNGRSLEFGTGFSIFVDNFYSKESFNERLEFVKKAGEKLREVNKELKEKREKWNGEETFVI